MYFLIQQYNFEKVQNQKWSRHNISRQVVEANDYSFLLYPKSSSNKNFPVQASDATRYKPSKHIGGTTAWPSSSEATLSQSCQHRTPGRTGRLRWSCDRQCRVKTPG